MGQNYDAYFSLYLSAYIYSEGSSDYELILYNLVTSFMHKFEFWTFVEDILH
jgi:hypothetical protein